MTAKEKRVVLIRADWVGDDTGYASFLSNGSVFVLRSEDHHDEPGLYLPDGTWKSLEPEQKRMGF